MATKDYLVAAVVLAAEDGGSGAPTLADMIAAARAAGAGPIVAVVPRGYTAPAGGRTVHVAPRASRISAIRAGMAQLTNTPLQFALVMPRIAASTDPAVLGALMSAARTAPAPFLALEDADLENSPFIIGREGWLDLMTLGEHGIGAVAARRATTIVRVRGEQDAGR